MEGIAGSGFGGASVLVKKKRSTNLIRPRSFPYSVPGFVESGGYGKTSLALDSRNDAFDSNQQSDGVQLTEKTLGDPVKTLGCKQGSQMGFQGAQPIGSTDVSAEKKLRNVKLKVGGAQTLQSVSVLEAAHTGSSIKSSSLDASHDKQKVILQDHSTEHSLLEKRYDSQVKVKNPNQGRFSHGVKGHLRDKTEQQLSESQTEVVCGAPPSEPDLISERVSKRRVSDDVAKNDVLKQCSKRVVGLEKQKVSKITNRKTSGDNLDGDYGLSPSTKNNRKRKSGRLSDDADYIEEGQFDSDADLNAKRKKHEEPSVDLADIPLRPLTTRQRALQLGKGATDGASANLIEFPDGLPPAPSRRKKEALSEVEQMLKKSEAAERRKLQVEKAARESEEAAIRKILGRTSDREKNKSQRALDEEEKKKAESGSLASNMVRWVMGPTGTVVTFSEEVGLPCILNSKPCRYPPPREKCAGPSCSNTYKYRDSKSNLPLCSLHCYKAVHQGPQQLTTC